MGAGHTHALYVHEHSVVHRLPPHVKIVAAFSAVAVVASTPPQAVWAFAIDALALLGAIRLARVPFGFVATRLLVVTPFLLMAALLPFVASGERLVVAGVPLAVEGLWGAFNVAAKALFGAGTSILLAATTEVPRLLRGLERLRVPPALTQIAAFMVRYLEVVAGELQRMRTAMVARGHDPRWLWQARPLAAAAGGLFVRSYERGERVHAAMLSRGWNGTMPVLEDEPETGARDWLLAASFPTVTLVSSLTWWALT